MKCTALLAVVAFLLAAGSASAAPKAIKGVVVAKRVHSGTIVLATGAKGLAVTVHTAPRSVRLGSASSVHSGPTTFEPPRPGGGQTWWLRYWRSSSR